MKKQKVSDAVIHRLPRYYRYLDELHNKGVVRISSNSLGQKMDITASQIRQDLSCFGEFGQQGYETDANRPISPCSSMYASMIRSKITHPPAKDPAAHTAAAGRIRPWGLGPEVP